jgi:hypothetical protein
VTRRGTGMDGSLKKESGPDWICNIDTIDEHPEIG